MPDKPSLITQDIQSRNQTMFAANNFPFVFVSTKTQVILSLDKFDITV